jgi:hypothetical protein
MIYPIMHRNKNSEFLYIKKKKKTRKGFKMETLKTSRVCLVEEERSSLSD